MKSCGSCEHFIKWKNDQRSGGLCALKDGRTSTDRGRSCGEWAGIKYTRPTNSEIIISQWKDAYG